MLEQELKTGDRVATATFCFGSAYVEGTITEVMNAGKPYVSYGVEWDDGDFEGETWGNDDLQLPKTAEQKEVEASEKW